ncbi:Uncharacterised protein [uncultured archaeon]|nr:Uncharacterised protein [uncultured archaeon]
MLSRIASPSFISPEFRDLKNLTASAISSFFSSTHCPRMRTSGSLRLARCSNSSSLIGSPPIDSCHLYWIIESKVNIPLPVFGSRLGFIFNFTPSFELAAPLFHHGGISTPNPLSVSRGTASFKKVYACCVASCAASGLAVLRLSSMGGYRREALPRSASSFSWGWSNLRFKK